jgi:hypothetical protein
VVTQKAGLPEISDSEKNGLLAERNNLRKEKATPLAPVA